MIQEIPAYVGGTGVFIVIVSFLSKQLVLHRLEKDLELHRAQLKAAQERELQALRHELEKASLEHQVKFQQIFSQRHDALAVLHKHLRRVIGLCFECLRVDGDSRVPTAVDAIITAKEKIAENEIYLPQSFCDNALRILVEAQTAVWNLRNVRQASQSPVFQRSELMAAVKTQ